MQNGPLSVPPSRTSCTHDVGQPSNWLTPGDHQKARNHYRNLKKNLGRDMTGKVNVEMSTRACEAICYPRLSHFSSSGLPAALLPVRSVAIAIPDMREPVFSPTDQAVVEVERLRMVCRTCGLQ
jgi:hypothetical protein